MRMKSSVFSSSFFVSRPPDNDFDPSALQKCRDVLYINVFDQVDVDLPTADRQQDQVIHKRISRNWLGSVKIPFSNIYVNERVSNLRSIHSKEKESCVHSFSWKARTV